jgi:hypothetical protein
MLGSGWEVGWRYARESNGIDLKDIPTVLRIGHSSADETGPDMDKKAGYIVDKAAWRLTVHYIIPGITR